MSSGGDKTPLSDKGTSGGLRIVVHGQNISTLSKSTTAVTYNRYVKSHAMEHAKKLSDRERRREQAHNLQRGMLKKQPAAVAASAAPATPPVPAPLPQALPEPSLPSDPTISPCASEADPGLVVRVIGGGSVHPDNTTPLPADPLLEELSLSMSAPSSDAANETEATPPLAADQTDTEAPASVAQPEQAADPPAEAAQPPAADEDTTKADTPSSEAGAPRVPGRPLPAWAMSELGGGRASSRPTSLVRTSRGAHQYMFRSWRELLADGRRQMLQHVQGAQRAPGRRRRSTAAAEGEGAG